MYVYKTNTEENGRVYSVRAENKTVKKRVFQIYEQCLYINFWHATYTATLFIHRCIEWKSKWKKEDIMSHAEYLNYSESVSIWGAQ